MADKLTYTTDLQNNAEEGNPEAQFPIWHKKRHIA